MVKCPECGEEVPQEALEKHAIRHWGVPFEQIDRLTNHDAKERYRTLMAGTSATSAPKTKNREVI